MSSSSLVAKRYANALFFAAQEKSIVAEVERDLKLVSGAVESDDRLISFLSHPGVDIKVKRDLLDEVFAKAVQPIVLDALKLMCDRRRTSQIAELAEHFSKIAGNELGQLDAQVFSAKTLSAEQLQTIQTAFTNLLGKEIRLSAIVNEELIGGIQVRVGDTLYDGSIAGKLARLQKTL